MQAENMYINEKVKYIKCKNISSLCIEANCFMYNLITEEFLRLLNKQPFNQEVTAIHLNEKTVNKQRRQFELP